VTPGFPASALTRAATLEARQRLTPALLNHSLRAHIFATALGDLFHVEVDEELLLAGALLRFPGEPDTPAE
jgi:hypothetical protein